jgi:hypothetical protein
MSLIFILDILEIEIDHYFNYNSRKLKKLLNFFDEFRLSRFFKKIDEKFKIKILESINFKLTKKILKLMSVNI